MGGAGAAFIRSLPGGSSEAHALKASAAANAIAKPAPSLRSLRMGARRFDEAAVIDTFIGRREPRFSAAGRTILSGHRPELS
jgi:hypothetical protein